MKIITIGDLHGKDVWSTVNPDEYDKIIFIGDYVDDFHISDALILHNLLNILEFKKKYPDKVELLWGNHELHYLFSYSGYGCSGYRQKMYPALHVLFNDNKDLFVPSYSIVKDDLTYIWTHAGIHEEWYKHYFSKYVEASGIGELTIGEQFKAAFDKGVHYLFQVGHLRGGFKPMGGIFWLDKSLLRKDPLQGVRQIAGHSKVSYIETIKINRLTRVTLVDCLDTTDKFYKLEI